MSDAYTATLGSNCCLSFRQVHVKIVGSPNLNLPLQKNLMSRIRVMSHDGRTVKDVLRGKR